MILIIHCCQIQKAGSTEKEESSESEDNVNMESVEDIYGRVIDKKTGECLSSRSRAKEKLDELEQRAGLLETEEHIKLKKSLRGLINRLNEHTLVGAVKMFSDLFASRGHNGKTCYL